MLKEKKKKEKFIAKRDGLNRVFTSVESSEHAVAGVDCAHG